MGGCGGGGGHIRPYICLPTPPDLLVGVKRMNQRVRVFVAERWDSLYHDAERYLENMWTLAPLCCSCAVEQLRVGLESVRGDDATYVLLKHAVVVALQVVCVVWQDFEHTCGECGLVITSAPAEDDEPPPHPVTYDAGCVVIEIMDTTFDFVVASILG